MTIQPRPSCFKHQSARYRIFLLVFIWVILLSSSGARAIDISDSPLNVTQKTPPPAVMFILDDSSSMDSEILTTETDGYFGLRAYVFQDGIDDHANVMDHRPMFGASYEPSANELRLWKSRWYGYNKIYYNPNFTYTPWPDYTGTPTTEYSFGQASTTTPKYDPRKNATITLNDHFFGNWDEGISNSYIRNSHYFLCDASTGRIYLVNLIPTTNAREYFELEDANGNEAIDQGELTARSQSDLPASLQPALTAEEDLENFANWFQYYRKRSLCAVAAVSQTVIKLSGVRVGLYSVNQSVVQSVLPIKAELAPPANSNQAPTYEDNTNDFLQALYTEYNSNGNTLLRRALAHVGEYFRGNGNTFINGNIGTFDYASEGGPCQKTYAILMTDGYWNDNFSWSLTNFISVDSSVSSDPENPDQDCCQNTLADVAAAYYNTDLSSADDLISPTQCNSNEFQHMVTFGVSFGIYGNFDPEAYNHCNGVITGTAPTWQNPTCGGVGQCEIPEKIDDLWHATVNSQGEFFNVSDPVALAQSLEDIFEGIAHANVSAAPVTVQNDQFYETTTYYQSSFDAYDWTGYLKAVRIYYDETDPSDPIKTATTRWEVDDQSMPAWDSRQIITYNPELTGNRTIPFSWSDLNPTQQSQILGGTATDGDVRINCLKGDDSQGTYRVVPRLGDIVHSSPVPVNGVLYVGANDGMLHAFNADTGDEMFAYVPNLVFPNLKFLLKMDYTHHYYVDQTPVWAKVEESGTPKVFLVGGLNAGGKGYYCLDITDIDGSSNPSATSLVNANIVRWEYQNDDDLGYTFSTPVIVKTSSTVYPYVVVFGNGYNSTNELAQLFVLDLFSGTEITDSATVAGSGSPIIFNTEKGGDNGMSSPIVVDINNDACADYVYAGDLNGNLWKLDMSSSNHLEWGFSHKTSPSDPTPEPLFTTLNNRPITSSPDVMDHCCNYGYMVCFGTGKFLGASDLTNTDQQAIYGIWDYGDSDDPGEYLGGVNLLGTNDYTLDHHPDDGTREVRIWAPETMTSHDEDGITLIDSVSSSSLIDWSTEPDATAPNQWYTNSIHENPIRHAGWMIEIPNSGERVYRDVSIQYGFLWVISTIPRDGYCNNGTTNILYTINPCIGFLTDEAQIIGDDDDDDDDDDDGLPPLNVDGKVIINDELLPFKKLFFWNEIKDH